VTRLAVFDLDGTLVDTAPDLVDTTNIVLARHDVPPITREGLKPYMSLGARAMIAGSLKAAGRTLPEDVIDTLYGEYLEHYASRIAKLSRPFPELLSALDRLEEANVRLAVCTNKREANAKALLTALDLISRFTFIAGANTFAVSKPDPGHLLMTIERAGGTPQRSVFVGDSDVDVATARAANMPIVGLTYGYSDVPMEELAPDRLMAPGEDVGVAILDLLAAQPA